MKRLRGAFWSNKKKGLKSFQGTYDFSSGEREYKLKGQDSKGKSRTISFESWQQAKEVGWVKVG